MACLGAVLYDPGTAATASTASLLAMTAFDTTNARITFTAPANGNVLVKLRVTNRLSTTKPGILLGVLDGSTVRARQTPIVSTAGGGSSNLTTSYEIVSLVTGLTPGNSYTWDAAYGVQVLQTSSVFGWGGPNDATANNAYGALNYEIWETRNLLAGTHYDPAVAVTKATTAALAMTAFDTTNLRLSFTSPSSGLVLVRLRCGYTGAGNQAGILLGVLDGATVRGRQAAITTSPNAAGAANPQAVQAQFVVPVAATTAFTWDAAYGVEFVQTSSNLAYGGPDDAVGADAYGGFTFEVWTAT